jgi:hypothetical protein
MEICWIFSTLRLSSVEKISSKLLKLMFAPFFGIAQPLLCQGAVGFRHLAFGVMGKDTLALGADFRCPHGTWNTLLKHFDFAAINRQYMLCKVFQYRTLFSVQ